MSAVRGRARDHRHRVERWIATLSVARLLEGAMGKGRGVGKSVLLTAAQACLRVTGTLTVTCRKGVPRLDALNAVLLVAVIKTRRVTQIAGRSSLSVAGRPWGQPREFAWFAWQSLKARPARGGAQAGKDGDRCFAPSAGKRGRSRRTDGIAAPSGRRPAPQRVTFDDSVIGGQRWPHQGRLGGAALKPVAHRSADRVG